MVSYHMVHGFPVSELRLLSALRPRRVPSISRSETWFRKDLDGRHVRFERLQH